MSGTKVDPHFSPIASPLLLSAYSPVTRISSSQYKNYTKKNIIKKFINFEKFINFFIIDETDIRNPCHFNYTAIIKLQNMKHELNSIFERNPKFNIPEG